jgi:tRNA A-37 threonylcarbamoyl transferase component Bud32
MELCLNLDEYLKIRNEGLSIEELKYILIELNKMFKKMHDNNIYHKNLNLSNILISLDKINKTSLKYLI